MYPDKRCIQYSVHLFLNPSVKELPCTCHKKMLFDSGVINLQTSTTNIFVSNTVLLSAVTCLEVTLCCENPFDVLAISDGVGCCEQKYSTAMEVCFDFIILHFIGLNY